MYPIPKTHFNKFHSTYVRGCEWITISTSIREVSSLSYASLAQPVVFFKHCLVERTIHSNMPPHQFNTILLGKRCLAANLFRLLRKEGVVRSGTRSRCTARTVQHVYRQIKTLVPCCCCRLHVQWPSEVNSSRGEWRVPLNSNVWQWRWYWC